MTDPTLARAQAGDGEAFEELVSKHEQARRNEPAVMAEERDRSATR
jgi:hypothetical protein